MKKWMFLSVLALVGAGVNQLSAQDSQITPVLHKFKSGGVSSSSGGCTTCGDSGSGYSGGGHGGGHGGGYGGGGFGLNGGAHPAAYRPYGSLFHHGPVLPVYQAAPWYLYWPYDAHFMTPAPIGGAFLPPPSFGGGYGNPGYFPQGGYPHGGFAPQGAFPPQGMAPQGPGGQGGVQGIPTSLQKR